MTVIPSEPTQTDLGHLPEPASSESAPLRASAPGKVILCGEYSVLEAHPALVLAVDRRVHVELAQLPLPQGTAKFVKVICPGYLSGSVRLHWQGEHLSAPAGSGLDMLLVILNELLAAAVNTSAFRQNAWQLRIDSRELFDAENKLGLGSSAALCAALDSALRTLGIGSDADSLASQNDVLARRWLRLHEIHSLAQGKRGSGVDIAASLNGACSQFVSAGADTVLRQYELPRGLHLAYVWTGASASTPAYLRSLSDWKLENPDGYRQAMDAMGRSMSTVIEASEAPVFIEALAQFTQALRMFACASGLSIFGAGHAQLFELAQNYVGTVYKPCGAGGGDLGLVVTNSAEQLDAFVGEVRGLGFQTIDLRIDPLGACAE